MKGEVKERERESGGRNECEKWKVASRVKYNTCLSVCLCLVVYRSEGSVGLVVEVVDCGPLWAFVGVSRSL